MNILLINLQSATERLAFQAAQMSRLGLSFERIEAISGADVDDAYYAKMRTSSFRIFSRNEIACFLSHQKCWEKCVSINQPVIIFEDDIVLDSDFHKLATDTLSKISSQAIIVNLERFGHKKRMSNKLIDLQHKPFALYELIYASAGAGAYIITPQAAKLCLQKAKKTIALPDSFLPNVSGIQLMQIVPAIAQQLFFFGNEENLKSTAQSSINVVGSVKPSGFESFLANPMTRVRRLLSWIDTVWKRHLKRAGTKAILLTLSDGVHKSLLETKRLLNG